MDDIGTDILLERPYLFEVGGERFAIYPPSLGLLSLMQIRLSKIGINPVALQSVGAIELLRVAKNKKKECCELIAIASCRTHEDALNDRETRRRAELFAECLDYDDVATLIVGVLQFNRHKQWMDEAGIIKERNRMAKVMRYKQGGGNTAQLMDDAQLYRRLGGDGLCVAGFCQGYFSKVVKQFLTNSVGYDFLLDKALVGEHTDELLTRLLEVDVLLHHNCRG